jgi:type IV pilus assembly protein PilC
MMLFVVPQLVDFLRAQDYALPWHSRALIWAAEQFSLLWWLFPLMIITSIGIGIMARQRSSHFALTLDGFLLQLPLLGALIRQRECAQFLHHLALLIGGGVPILPALHAARTSLNNHALQQQTNTMIQNITAGADLATIWQTTPAFTGIIARRAQIGLQTGTLAHQLQQASTECDQATLAQSKQLIGALEPTLTLLVGALLAWIVLAVLGPLYGALGTLGR